MSPSVRAALFLVLIPVLVRADDPPLIAPGEHRPPVEEAKAFRLPPGFTAQLVAAEPDIQKPINMAFDTRGRLWVTCTVEYPFPAKDRPGRDSIRILEDFGPDGRARKITTFADQLNIPIGILPDEDANGCIAFSMPSIWRLRDTDGDGKVDSREILLSGFGTRDTHGMVNGLVRGFDGWVYACHGYLNDSVIQGKDGSRIVMNSGNTFRFRPDGSRVEMVSRGQVNPFGQCLDPYGNLYTACCHSKPITQLLRGAVFTSFSKPHDGLGFGPDMVHEYRGSTALCGLAWYDADQYPSDYLGRMFLGDVVNNCVNIFDIDRTGASYAARQRKDDFLSSSDPWFRPVDIKLGPDGALYVADFYNRIIGHYEVPLTHPGRDRTSGRIWRIVYTGDAPARRNWTRASTAELVADLAHPNLTVRMLATSGLMQHSDREGVAKAVQSAARSGSPTQRVHALWLCERLQQRDHTALMAALSDASPLLRVHALRIFAEQPRWTQAEQDAVQRRLHDSDALVRRVAVDALDRHPSSEVLEALISIRREPATVPDEFLMHTVRMAIRDHLANPSIAWPRTSDEQVECLADAALGTTDERAANFLAANLATLAGRRRSRTPEFLHHAARYAAMSRIGDLTSVIEKIGGDNPALSGRLLVAWIAGLRERGKTNVPTTEWALKTGRQLLASETTDDVRLGIEVALALRQSEFAAAIAKIIGESRYPAELRADACTALATLDGPACVPTLAAQLANGREAPLIRDKAAEALARLPQTAARAALFDALNTAPARLANTIAAAMAGSREGASALLDHMEAGRGSPRLLLERPVRAKFDALKQPAIQDRIAKLTNGLPSPDTAIQEILKRYAANIVSKDPANGSRVFQKHCATCHQVGGQGTKIGPHLDGIGVRGLDRLLEDVLDPNRNVDPAFRTTIIVLKSGVSLSGLVLREDGAILVLADNQGKEQRVEKSQIESRDLSPLSPMPANWGDQITNGDLGDLIGYLLTLRGK